VLFTDRDNAKKALIISVRRKLLGNLEAGIARRSRLVIVAHPKSGNTWLKVMLTRLYGIRHGIAPEDFASYPALADRNPDIPRFAATNGWYSYERAVGDLLKPEAPDSEAAISTQAGADQCRPQASRRPHKDRDVGLCTPQ
jgi:hypothetical protein